MGRVGALKEQDTNCWKSGLEHQERTGEPKARVKQRRRISPSPHTAVLGDPVCGCCGFEPKAWFLVPLWQGSKKLGKFLDKWTKGN